jgi:hypothetical protein
MLRTFESPIQAELSNLNIRTLFTLVFLSVNSYIKRSRISNGVVGIRIDILDAPKDNILFLK